MDAWESGDLRQCVKGQRCGDVVLGIGGKALTGWQRLVTIGVNKVFGTASPALRQRTRDRQPALRGRFAEAQSDLRCPQREGRLVSAPSGVARAMVGDARLSSGWVPVPGLDPTPPEI